MILKCMNNPNSQGSILFKKYTVDILLYLLEEKEAPKSRFNGLKGEYNLIIDRVEELEDLGFVSKIEPQFGSVKAVYRLTSEGETLAEELLKIEGMARDLKKDSEGE